MKSVSTSANNDGTDDDRHLGRQEGNENRGNENRPNLEASPPNDHLVALIRAQQAIISRYQCLQSPHGAISDDFPLSADQILELFKAAETNFAPEGEELEFVEGGEAPLPDEYAASKADAPRCESEEMKGPEIINDNEAPIPEGFIGVEDGDEGRKKLGGDPSPHVQASHGINARRPPKPILDPSQLIEVVDVPLSLHSASEHSETASERPDAATDVESPPEFDFEASARLIGGSARCLPLNDQQEVSTQSPVFDGIPVPQASQNLLEIQGIPSAPMQAPVCDAIPISNPPTDTWWKRHGFIAGASLVIGALVAAVGLLARQQKSSDVNVNYQQGLTSTTLVPPATSTEMTNTNQPMGNFISLNSTTTTPTTTTTTTRKCVKNVQFLQTLFSEECLGDCSPSFGYRRFAIDGDTAVASKHEESIHFFSINNGNFKLETTIPIDYWVDEITLFGDVAVVGSPYEDGFTGAVYVYERSPLGEWEQTMRIVPDDIVGQVAWFGSSVSLSDDAFVVGAPEIDAAYIYRRSGSTWELETKLVPEDATLRWYGSSVSIVGNVVAVGDYDGGQVIIFHFDSSSNSWKQLGERIVNYDCSVWFGIGVALTSDNGLLIGCKSESTLDYAGAVYYYEQSDGDDEFVVRQKIMASDAAGSEWFGGGRNRIAVDGDVMIVGTDIVTNGKAYIFTRVGNVWNVWNEVAIIHAPGGSVPSFGYRVAISQNKILVYSDTNVYTYGLDIEYC